MTSPNLTTYRKAKSDTLDATEADGNITVGLVPSPGQCERILADIEESLPQAFSENIDDNVTWEIRAVTDPLTGSDVETPRLLHEIDELKREHDWDYAICLTDLPVHDQDGIVVADASIERKLAWLSVPPLGIIRLRHRVRAAIVELMNELHWGTPRDAPERQRHPHRTDHLNISRGLVKEADPPEDDREIDIRYLAPRIVGQGRLLAGMVYANRPWTLFPSFKTTIATAFATGGYGLIFSSLWKLGNIYGIWRLVLLMVVAMAILIGWIIISHGLWQRHRGAASQYLTTLYNSATLLTIATGVVFAYVLVFLLLLCAALIYIPAAMLETTIQQAITPMSFVRIAWITASVATIAGAIGAGLEDSEAVRKATFGWRQQRRLEEYEASWGDGSSGGQDD